MGKQHGKQACRRPCGMGSCRALPGAHSPCGSSLPPTLGIAHTVYTRQGTHH